MKSYIKSLFSSKKLKYKNISFFALWDDNSVISNKSLIDRFSRLSNSSVGRYSRVNKHCKIVNADICNFTGVSMDCQIGTGGHPTYFASTSILFHKENKLTNKWVKPFNFSKGRIMIGNDVWVGMKSLVIDGVKIGDGAIVGAQSVVTKDVPPYAIVAGSPAKIIRYRFTPEIIDRLLEIKWWDLEDDEINEKLDFFHEHEITLKVLNKYFPNKNE